MKQKKEPLWIEMYRKDILKPQQRKRMTEQKGRTEASQAGFYNTPAWKSLRDRRRLDNPLCQHCEDEGRITPMTVVDHPIPVDEAPELALDYNNTQSLCDYHHQVKTNEDKKRKAFNKRLEIGRKIMEDLEKKYKGEGGSH